MNILDPQTMYATWMSQFSDPKIWQTLFQPPAQLNMDQFTAILQEQGAELNTEVVQQLQQKYVQNLSTLWQDFMSSNMPEITDKRFSAPAWQANPLNAFNVAVYLLNSQFLLSLVDAVKASHKVKQKISFSVQQIIDAMSPANFLASNPEAQQKIVESKGESLAKGMANMLMDVQKGRISQTDESAFEVAKNLAITPGSVVFENELCQLIQYKPSTKTVFERPLLIVPPCINKYYILDLQPENSFVRYAVEQGQTVFLISWRNPDDSMQQVTWDQYIEDAVIQAIHVVQNISKQDQINTLGFCIGGTMLSMALAVLYARGEKPTASMTLLTTLLDFSDTGALDVFVNEATVALQEQTIGSGGLMLGRDFSSTFSSLRPADLVWNYVQSNYLKGEAPTAFDLLYWNADNTNVAGPMVCWYLKNLYLENKLIAPGKLTVAGTKVDLGKLNTPVFVYGSREDHIVPWMTAYESMRVLNPKKPARNRFVLGASGHIAGVINPPSKNKRSYWVNNVVGVDADTWKKTATEYPGSWWPEWMDFLIEHAGKKVKAPTKPGNITYKAIEPAPGRYVTVRLD